MARGDQLGRQWKIIQTLISSKMGKSASDLAQDLECNPRTIYRDLEALQVAESGGQKPLVFAGYGQASDPGSFQSYRIDDAFIPNFGQALSGTITPAPRRGKSVSLFQRSRASGSGRWRS